MELIESDRKFAAHQISSFPAIHEVALPTRCVHRTTYIRYINVYFVSLLLSVFDFRKSSMPLSPLHVSA